jgi:hypothetical protein
MTYPGNEPLFTSAFMTNVRTIPTIIPVVASISPTLILFIVLLLEYETRYRLFFDNRDVSGHDFGEAAVVVP